MNRRDYRLHLDGYQAAARGAGLSDSPHGGTDGDLWRGGVREWLDQHGDEPEPAPGRFGSPAQDAPGVAIGRRPVC